LIAGRYALGREIGSGGFGTVYEATDTVAGGRVALKRFHAADAQEAARVRREIAALRLLRNAGVVRLLDDGEQDSGLFITMELVDGTPFPGRPKPCAWEDIADTTIALLGVLAEVHDAGVVHRDLKPSNILVDERGVPTLLDFGLARGTRLGPTITVQGTALGTPQYLSPEQAFGLPTDARADLWAVGALVFEALTGLLPHAQADADSDVAPLIVRRATEPVAPIRSLLPDLAEPVAAAIDALLVQRPEDRPATARDALRLFGHEDAVATPSLPELRPEAVARAVAVVLDGRRGLRVTGPHGAGHTHVLDAVAAAARLRGVTAIRAVPGRAPFSSLEPLVGPLEGRRTAGIEEMVGYCRSAVRAALADGAVLLVDNSDLVDPWSREVLYALGGDRPVICATANRMGHVGALHGLPGAERVRPECEELPLAPLTERDLQRLFDGPDRILHLREDAARELYRRSRGLPAVAAAEVAQWLRVGLAERSSTGLRLTRSDIERLASDSHTAVRVQAGGRLERGRARGSMEVSGLVHRAVHLREVARLVLLAGSAASREVISRAWPDTRWRLEAALGELDRVGIVVTQADGTLTLDGIAADHLDLDPAARRDTHSRIADALDRRDPRRILHLVVAERFAEVGAAALIISEHLERGGQQERALAVLADALAITRAAGELDVAANVAVRLALVAVTDGNDMAMQQALYELQPNRTRGMDEATVVPARQLVDGALRGARLGAAAGVPEVDDLSRYSDVRLATWHWTLKVRAARAEPLERERAVIAEACAWARAVGGPFAIAHERAWQARLAYREGRWRQAAELSTLVASERTLPFALRLSARTNAASALMEQGDLDGAVEAASEAAREAADCRHAYYELRALWICRTAAFRRGDTLELDPELPTLAAAVGVPYLEALLHITEAAICWRRGAWPAMAEHARKAAERSAILSMEVPEILSRLLHRAATGGAGRVDAERWFERIRHWGSPGLCLQGAALLAVATGRVLPAWGEVVAEAYARHPEEQREHRLEVMSAEEGLAIVAALRDGAPQRLPRFVSELVGGRGNPATAT